MRPAHALALAPLVLACVDEPREPTPAVEPSYPPGTVLLVDDVAILAAEVEPVARLIQELYPQYTPAHCTRLALTNLFLPRAAVQSHFPDTWQAARRRCTEARAQPEGGEAEVVEGHWRELGLDLWQAADGLAVGEWSEPLPLVGRFALLRVEERRPGTATEPERMRVSVRSFRYLSPAEMETGLDWAIEQSRLTIVDPLYRELVPAAWVHRMDGGND